MATPSPINSIRNTTIWLTDITWVRTNVARNVTRIEIPATSSSTSARKLANTKASTISAPKPPSSVSASTPTPCGGGAVSTTGPIPVTRTVRVAAHPGCRLAP